MKVSVIIAAYNEERYLSDCIESVMKQTYPVEEIIVVDDGSTDSTVKIAHAFGLPVHVIQQTNSGVSVARNNGIENASGDLIAFLDADDIWRPDKLRQQVEYLNSNNDVIAVASGFSVFGKGIGVRDVHTSDSEFLNYQPIDHLIVPRVHLSTLVVRSKVAKMVRFLENIGDAEDLIYVSYLRTFGPIGSVDNILVGRRQHPSQATNKLSHFTRGIRARVSWARENYQLLSVESPDAVESALFDGAVLQVMANYWARDFVRFREWRQELLAAWPKNKPVPKKLLRVIPPRVLVRLKDFIKMFKFVKVEK